MQSRLDSFKETVTQVALGSVLGTFVHGIIFPMVGVPLTLEQNLNAAVLCSLVSLLKTYGIRRLYNSTEDIDDDEHTTRI